MAAASRHRASPGRCSAQRLAATAAAPSPRPRRPGASRCARDARPESVAGMAIESKGIAPPDRVRVRRALISVYDKTGLIELAAELARRGIEIVSTGGTRAAI